MTDIGRLLGYALHQRLIDTRDITYHINRLRSLLKRPLESLYYEMVTPLDVSFNDVITSILENAIKDGLIDEDSVHEKDRLETQIMDLLTPLPSTIQTRFDSLKNPKEKTDYFYHIVEANHYIKKERVEKNRLINVKTKYGILKGTINLSKPEKDPKMIARVQEKTYPECLLCKEMEGLEDITKPPRNNHRVIQVSLNDEPFFMQYSPYVYYREHAIIIHQNHIPMEVGEKTFKRLLDFVDLLPHYFIGSNAGLPIVGGSILSHEHYQGGLEWFPLDDAKVLEEVNHNDLIIERLQWPLSVLRIKSKNKASLIDACTKLDTFFKNYSDATCDLVAYTIEPHNAITPIARKIEGTYQMTIALRNNRISEKYPDGIFHTHKEHQAIKKENIGLIEVLGLGILPGRLNTELKEVSRWLADKESKTDLSDLMKAWALSLNLNEINQKAIDEAAVNTFVHGLEDAGIFKDNHQAFQTFITSFKETL